MINAADTVVTAAITKTMAAVVSPVFAVSVLGVLGVVLAGVFADGCTGAEDTVLVAAGFDVSGLEVGSETGSTGVPAS